MVTKKITLQENILWLIALNLSFSRSEKESEQIGGKPYLQKTTPIFLI
jgi:hypothetical protein